MTAHTEAQVCVIVTCSCGDDFEGLSYSAASRAFEDHLAAQERYGTVYSERFGVELPEHRPGGDRNAS